VLATYSPQKNQVDSCKIKITTMDGTIPILTMSTCELLRCKARAIGRGIIMYFSFIMIILQKVQ